MMQHPEPAATGREFREDLRRPGLPPAVLKELNRIRPRRAALSLAETWGSIGLCVAAAVLWWHPLVIAAAMLIIATRQQALFVLAHDAAHYRLFRQRRLNDLAGRLCGAAVGISMCSYRVLHRLHHNHLYEAQDPDIPLHGGYPRGKGYLLRKLGKDLAGLTAFKTYRYFFGLPAQNREAGSANRPLDDTAPALRQDALDDRWFVLGLHGALLVGAGATGLLLPYLLLWAVPLVTLLQPILRLRAVCEHGAVWDYSSPLTAARTNLGPAWLRWLLFPHQVNFHIEHHMYPAIPHYNLPRCHREMRARGLLREAEVRPIAETLRRIFAAPEPAAAAAP